ncbi:hypothetical protein VP01_6845g1 [Puccinia sorghi]|uniref:Uncharacterized protein n=1 Tax=Puccinia sorghi TaxID=27349 RepID=A0A0L6UGK3_9BASI|nr:hypothetical protein VP01_6845g1 [Puccinia sorghi]
MTLCCPGFIGTDVAAARSWTCNPLWVTTPSGSDSLRLLLVNHYLNQPSGEAASQWEIIYQYLERLSSMSQVKPQVIDITLMVFEPSWTSREKALPYHVPRKQRTHLRS